LKAAWYEQNGSARDVMTLGELEKPVAAPGQVLVRMHAIGLNPVDWKMRLSAPLPPGITRIVPNQDGAGVIEAVGKGVPTSRLGERVWIYEALHSTGAGCAAEYVVVPNRNAILLPEGISFETGASLGVPALTAHRCVFADGSVKGQSILVTGGAGSVGALAIQFAKHGGASVVTTISNVPQAQVARAAGADVIVDRNDEDGVARINTLAGGVGERNIDRVIDVAFGTNLDITLKVLKENGVIATYSSDAEPEPTLPFWPLIRLNATIHFVLKTTMSIEAHDLAIEATSAGLRARWLHTTIAARFTFDQIVEAYESAESGKNIGKVVVLVP
jgi:NADPH2:quinone reductase